MGEVNGGGSGHFLDQRDLALNVASELNPGR